MSKKEIPQGVVNGIQLNIVSTIDYKSIMRSQYASLNDAVFLTDNAFESTGKGTPDLETICTQGQVLNWLVFPINIDEFTSPKQHQNPNQPKFYSPTVRISNIVFLRDNGEIYQEKICDNLHSYGSLEKGRPYLCPPVFFYWAANVRVNLPPGQYKYRLIYEIDDYYKPDVKHYLNLDSASLYVVPLETK